MLDELLANPAVQAGVAPFLVALAVGALLRRTRLLGLAIAAAFATVIGLTVGYSFETLTAMRKLVLVGLGTAALVPVLEMRPTPGTILLRAVLVALAATAGIWVVWRVLQQQEALKIVLYGAAAGAYVGLLVVSSLRLGSDAIRACAISSVLGLAAGGLALLGASALLGQVGIALAAGSGAVLLLQMIGAQRSPAGWTLVLPGAVIAGVAGLAAVFTGSLPWFCLLPTLAIPWATRLVRQDRFPPWLTSVLTVLAAVVPALLALGLAWYAAAA